MPPERDALPRQSTSDDFTEMTIIPAEGARVGFITCKLCGAAILVDPRDDTDWPKKHKGFHASLMFGGGGIGIV